MIGTLLSLPLLPLKGVVALARVIADEADRQLYSMPSLRRELDDLQRLRAQGRIDPEEYQRREQQVLDRALHRGGESHGG
ncbi:gas vesicle protein GvpG [Nocardia sp. CDC160]|uniref:gas vesicle protein GvpG n=1 Tax=Nocardia sp. CDC160 TaxID=3112166 RepID=UPI002DBF6B7A|nr:gas vesicle protein GvpG [Nocardia sp. CDC160]MEC3919025.1 gas vesicle protein GvpG [Nocardia sp. CDC160]